MGGKLWILVNFIYGMGRQLLPFGAAIYVIGLVIGWLYRPWLRPAFGDVSGEHGVSFVAPFRATIGVLIAAAAVLGLRHFYQQRTDQSGSVLERLRVTTMNLVYLGMVCALFGIAVPHLILLLEDPPNIVDWIESGKSLAVAELAGLSVISVLGWLARKGIFSRLVPFVIPIIGPLLVGIPFALAAKVGVEEGIGGRSLAWWVVALGWLIFVWLALDLVTPSMHRFYRERLSTVFVGLRRRREGRLEFRQPPWSRPVKFSQMQDSPNPKATLPKLVVCAAANVSSDVPPGRLAASFTFESDVSGGPLTGYVSTQQLEKEAGQGIVTLPAMMAISGAAVSPSMGKATRASYRLLLALFNVRLGVWVPNPRRLLAFESFTGPAQTTPSLTQGVKRKARRPGMAYLLREALGINSLSSKYIYVSDGGHWENLGLVELLRRGCTQIICIDASGDDPGRYDTLGEAIALARSELGIEVEIDCEPLSPGEDGLSEASHVVGTIQYPPEDADSVGRTGVLIVAKAVLTSGSPLDVRSFGLKDKRFPRHSTGDQLFDDQQFESYRALGAYACDRALDDLNAIRAYNGLDAIGS